MDKQARRYDTISHLPTRLIAPLGAILLTSSLMACGGESVEASTERPTTTQSQSDGGGAATPSDGGGAEKPSPETIPPAEAVPRTGNFDGPEFDHLSDQERQELEANSYGGSYDQETHAFIADPQSFPGQVNFKEMTDTEIAEYSEAGNCGIYFRCETEDFIKQLPEKLQARFVELNEVQQDDIIENAIYYPKDPYIERIIREYGAHDISITDENYDDPVRYITQRHYPEQWTETSAPGDIWHDGTSEYFSEDNAMFGYHEGD